MTDKNLAAGRMDLDALDAQADAVRDAAVMRAVMNRIVATPQQDVELATLLRHRRVMVAVAAALVAVAAGIASQRPRPVAETAGDVIARWIDAGHVPSNADLLAVMPTGER